MRELKMMWFSTIAQRVMTNTLSASWNGKPSFNGWNLKCLKKWLLLRLSELVSDFYHPTLLNVD